MFVANGQFFIIITCVAYGFVAGSLFTILTPLRMVVQNTIIRAILDVICFVILCFLFVVYSNLLNFPNFRVYMVFGVLLGLILYIESLHFILAKLVGIVYNKICKMFTKRRTSAKGIKTNE